MVTSQLRIMAPSVGADSTVLKPLIHELDIVEEIGELGKDLVALQSTWDKCVYAERRVERVHDSA